MKKGDIVTCEADWLPVMPGDTKPKAGIVIETRGDSIAVEFPEIEHGHNCAGRAKDKQGWFCPANILTLVEPAKEVEFPF